MGKTTVHLIGGHGGLTDRYAAVAAEFACELRHYERDAPATLGERAIVVVCMSMASHDQRWLAARLAARCGLEVLVMPRHGAGTLRTVLAALPPCATSNLKDVWDASHELSRRSEDAFRSTLRRVREDPRGLWGECRGCGSTLLLARGREAGRVTAAVRS